ncbi:FecCD family ABC transporter permease [Phytoactinopolyspora mesophila]|uniref:Iron chelate uptake ABC transporter family permease subunit n=1 Tax=Phytoactinopolyspora mesophila TaxID=2650750 RepID=A0A7K3M1T5_9ACTN|nr:iron ABC transporter permease [Phytoactinopolyspora mesophila]NDL56862.1 iron chelate uptake ABC transporter family permease subunit [Phytoactinopolyspora mesophila]
MRRPTTTNDGARRRVTIRSGSPAFSRRIDVRVATVLGVSTVLVVVLGAYSMSLGAVPVPLPEIAKTLVGQGSGQYDLVVLELRLPRVAVAILAGAALGLSGALFQSFARNPLVAPDIIGVNAGAGLVAVAILTVYTGHRAMIPAGAFAGAIAAAAVVYFAARTGHLSPYRLVLIGIGVDVFCRAGISYFLVQGESANAQAAVRWMVGSLSDVDRSSMWFLLVAVAVLAPAAMALRRPMEVMTLGDDSARSLGTRTELARAGVLLTGVLLAASAVAVCGPVAFVAFIAPHLARRIAKAPGTAVFPVAAAVGAVILLSADHVALHVVPVSLPVGVITPLIGGPYFLYLLRRASRREEFG